MANFLNRIAQRGAGHRSLATPSVVAPPLLPGHAHGAEVATTATLMDRQDAPSPSSVGQPLRQETLTERVPPVVSPDQPEPPAPSAPEPASVQSAPGDFSPQQGLASPPVRPDAVRVPRRLSRDAAGIDQPKRSVPEIVTAPTPTAIVRAPGRAPRTITPTPAQTESVGMKRDSEGPETPKNGGDQHATSIEPPAAPHPAPPVPVPAIRPTRKRSEDPVWQERTTAPPVAMPSVGDQAPRGSRVTFGQIDVQVINQPTPTLPPTPPTAEPTSFGTVEIERFKVRLP